MKNDPSFKLNKLIAGSIRQAISSKGFKKDYKNKSKFLPHTIEELKIHLENLFEPWMNWQNNGKYIVSEWNDDDQSTWMWQLDHIVPHSTFSYSSMEDQEFRDCWALSNLRPLSAKQNILDGTSRSRHK